MSRFVSLLIAVVVGALLSLVAAESQAGCRTCRTRAVMAVPVQPVAVQAECAKCEKLQPNATAYFGCCGMCFSQRGATVLYNRGWLWPRTRLGFVPLAAPQLSTQQASNPQPEPTPQR